MNKVDRRGVRTWIEIDKKALKNNYQTFRGLISKKCKLMAIAKSNAYGHSLIDYAKEMATLGADFIGVDSMTEAVALRREGIKTPILVLGYTLPELYPEAAENNISITISSLDQTKDILRFIKSHHQDSIIKIHLKIDTGMHRQGFGVNEVERAVAKLKAIGCVKIEGIYTHFASAKNPSFPGDTNHQIAGFKDACKVLETAKINPIRHAAATGGAIAFPESHFDMVRIGIGLMGLWPSAETQSAYEGKLKLIPALSWKTVISEIKEIKKGERIGYGFTELFEKDTKIAILPIGYWHGYKWSLSSVGHVIVGGKKAKVCGRVSMDMVTIDITEIPDAKVGDIITLLGRDGNQDITPDEMAILANSYNYEIITTINPLIKRYYV